VFREISGRSRFASHEATVNNLSRTGGKKNLVKHLAHYVRNSLTEFSPIREKERGRGGERNETLTKKDCDLRNGKPIDKKPTRLETAKGTMVRRRKGRATHERIVGRTECSEKK